MDASEKTRENRVRRLARRRGLELQRHRARDTRHVLYGTYQITRPDGIVTAAKDHGAFGRSYGLTLDEAEKILTGDPDLTDRLGSARRIMRRTAYRRVQHQVP